MPFPEDDHVSGGIMGGEMRSYEDKAADEALEAAEASKTAEAAKPKFRTEGV